MDWLNSMNKAIDYIEDNKAGKMGVLGVCKDFNMAKNEFNYMIAVEDTMEALPKEYIKATIPDATWAIFYYIWLFYWEHPGAYY